MAKIMNYELFKYKVNDLGLKVDEDLYFPQESETHIRVWDCKERRLLASISKTEPYNFEVDMGQEFWATNEKADELIKLIASLSRTVPEDRE